jgi:hypothetical protein
MGHPIRPGSEGAIKPIYLPPPPEAANYAYEEKEKRLRKGFMSISRNRAEILCRLLGNGWTRWLVPNDVSGVPVFRSSARALRRYSLGSSTSWKDLVLSNRSRSTDEPSV